MTSKLFRIIIACFALATPCGAQTTEQVAFWSNAVGRNSLKEISSMMGSKGTPSWPRIDSVATVGNAPSPLQENKKAFLTLIDALHEKARQDFDASQSPIEEKIQYYCKLANALQSAGGYSNILLADCFYRLALFRTSKLLVSDPKHIEQVKALVKEINVPDINVQMLLLEFIEDDAVLKQHREEISKITPNQNIYSIMHAVGIDFDVMVTANSLNFSHLMKEPSAFGLLLRMAGTSLFRDVSLGGLVAFTEQGGVYAEIDPSDIRAFRQRVSGAGQTFRYPLLGVKSLSVNHVLSIFEMHRGDGKQSAFLRSALE